MKLLLQILSIVFIFFAIACELDEPELKSEKKCIIPSRIIANEDTTIYGKFDLQLDGSTTDISKIVWKSTGPDGNVYNSVEKTPTFTFKKPGTYSTTAAITSICGETSTIVNSQVLRSCIFPDSISAQYDPVTFGKLKLTLKGDTKDIVNVKWVTKNEKGAIVDSVSNKERFRETTLASSGKYFTNATITTKCGDSKIIQANLGIRACVPPDKLLNTADDKIWGAFNFNFGGNISDISTIQWTTYNAQNTIVGTGNSKPSYEIKLNAAGEYRTTAKITTICKDDVPPYEVKYSLKPCELPSKINVNTLSWGDFAFDFMGEISDITQVIWTTTDYLGMPINTITKTNKADLLYTFKIVKAGDYTTKAEFTTRCGDKKTLEVKYTLKACELPSALNVNSNSYGNYNFNFNGTMNDIKSITWYTKNASGTEVNRYVRTDKNDFLPQFNISVPGLYTTTAEINSFCGDKKTLEVKFELKACNTNGTLEVKRFEQPIVQYWGTYGYKINNINYADVSSITWNTKNKNNGNLVTNEEVRSNFNEYYFIIMPGGGDFTVTATVKFNCGETKEFKSDFNLSCSSFVNNPNTGTLQIRDIDSGGQPLIIGDFSGIGNIKDVKKTYTEWKLENTVGVTNYWYEVNDNLKIGSKYFNGYGTYTLKITIETQCGEYYEFFSNSLAFQAPVLSAASAITSEIPEGHFRYWLFIEQDLGVGPLIVDFNGSKSSINQFYNSAVLGLKCNQVIPVMFDVPKTTLQATGSVKFTVSTLYDETSWSGSFGYDPSVCGYYKILTTIQPYASGKISAELPPNAKYVYPNQSKNPKRKIR